MNWLVWWFVFCCLMAAVGIWLVFTDRWRSWEIDELRRLTGTASDGGGK